jgi:tRNA-2-methylthio-N6-dimethylallyladenosine synthase
MPENLLPIVDNAVEIIDGKETTVAVTKRNVHQAAKGLLYVETYGCQMNFSDTEIVTSVMQYEGYGTTDDPAEADVIFINTCAIRENAEDKIFNRLKNLRPFKRKNPKLVVGVLGCMAERMRKEIFEKEKIIDVLAGPDAYKDIPRLLGLAESGQKAANTFLSLEETYTDITPVRKTGVGALVTIMRGCDNMCSFCVVPFTRGRERSRSVQSILDEIKTLSDEGFKEITLLGQNVNSYFDDDSKQAFPELLYKASLVNRQMRIRFTTSHPKDFSDELINVIAEGENICKSIHLPVQSGSSRILDKMSRTYDRDSYLATVEKVYKRMPDVSLSTDIIAGFPTETDADHAETLSLLKAVQYDYAYTFIYSERPNTPAAKNFADDVPPDVKQQRLDDIITLQRQITFDRFQRDIGKTFEVLVEDRSKRSEQQLMGRTDTNKAVIFPNTGQRRGDYVRIKIEHCNSATLFGTKV